MPSAIEVSGLTKRYSSLVAVSDLTLVVEAGDIFGFLGPNGAGKTTTLRMMTGLVRPTSGSVRIFGRDMQVDFPRALEGVGALVESPALYPYLDAIDNLAVLGRTFGVAGRKRILELLELVGLSGHLPKRVRTYSQGMRQRLGFALALLSGTRVLMLDEPANGLDPPGRAQLRRILRDLSQKQEVAIFISSHLLGDVEAMCDRVGLLHEGRLVAEGGLSDLLRPRAWRVRVAGGGVAEAKIVAEGIPWCGDAVVVDGCLEVVLDRDKAADLCARLVGGGIRVEEFAPIRPTLENFFSEKSRAGGDR